MVHVTLRCHVLSLIRSADSARLRRARKDRAGRAALRRGRISGPGRGRGSACASSRAAASSSPCTARSASWNSGMPLWRVPRSSPAPRSRKSSSAMTKPSSVSRMVFSRAFAVSPSGAVIDEQAARFRRAAPDAPAQLMKLRQAEAFGMLDHHDRRFRHIDADFDHGGGDEDLRLARLELRHRRVALRAFHLAMHEADLRPERLAAASRRVLPRRRGRSSRTPRPADTPNRRARLWRWRGADARPLRPAGRRTARASRPACGPAAGR